MKILHTADWHLGKKLDHFSRLDEQQIAMDELVAIAEREQVHAVIVAGDLFDQFNPSIEATELLYRTLKRLANEGRRAVIGIAGNHDSPDRIEAPDPLARECGIVLAGYPDSEVKPFSLPTGLAVTRSGPGWLELQLPGQPAPLRVVLAPFANELRLRQYLGGDSPEALRDALTQRWQAIADAVCDTNGVNVMAGHLLAMRKGEARPDEPEEERPISIVGGAPDIFSSSFPPQLQYVALGHLHGYRIVQSEPVPAVYSSSPLAYSMSEAGQQKYAILVEAEPGQPATWTPIPLSGGKPLLRVRCHSVDEAVAWLNDNPGAWVELTLKTTSYLTAEDRQRLYTAHPGIVTLVPEAAENFEGEQATIRSLDLSQSMEALFGEYFRHKLGNDPAPEMVDLFREVLAFQPDDNG